MTISASRDANGVPALICASSADGITPVAVTADPTTHAVSASDGTTGADHGVPAAERDANNVPVLMAVSSVDGRTPVEVYADAGGNLLIQST